MVKRRARRGIMFIDCVVGISLLTVVIVLLLTITSGWRKSNMRLGATRTASHVADHVASQLRAGDAPTVPAEAEVEVVDVPDAAPGGWRWVEIRVRVVDRRVTRFALVPAAGGAK
jgi:hypothetical protein